MKQTPLRLSDKLFWPSLRMRTSSVAMEMKSMCECFFF